MFYATGCPKNYILQISFSGPGIDDLLAEVNKQLSYKIRGEFNNKYRQQAMFELLGQAERQDAVFPGVVVLVKWSPKSFFPNDLS